MASPRSSRSSGVAVRGRGGKSWASSSITLPTPSSTGPQRRSGGEVPGASSGRHTHRLPGLSEGCRFSGLAPGLHSGSPSGACTWLLGDLASSGKSTHSSLQRPTTRIQDLNRAVKRSQASFRPPEGPPRPREGGLSLPEGPLRPREGSFSLPEGRLRPREGPFSPPEGPLRPGEGALSLREGGSALARARSPLARALSAFRRARGLSAARETPGQEATQMTLDRGARGLHQQRQAPGGARQGGDEMST